MTALPIFADVLPARRASTPKKLCVVSLPTSAARRPLRSSPGPCFGSDIGHHAQGPPEATTRPRSPRLSATLPARSGILNHDMIDTAGASGRGGRSHVEGPGRGKGVRVRNARPVFSGPAYQRIENSCIEEVVVHAVRPGAARSPNRGAVDSVCSRLFNLSNTSLTVSTGQPRTANG